ncbi:MAG: prephenate dehydratase [Pseudomonadota bacterium]
MNAAKAESVPSVKDTRGGRIAFQGEPGANSDTACRNVFPNMDPVPCPTFEDAFEALKGGQTELAMIPIENTLAGRVADIHQLLPNSGLHIIGEYFLPIDFHLMALPGVARADIKTVYSHIHALGQCRDIIRNNGWTGVVAGDTAGAAKMIADTNDRKAAALAPRLAAGLYGLDILAEKVQDAESNITRFVILSREPEVPAMEEGPAITTFVFRVKNVPAALYKVMGGFATNGVNMTKLESYQIGGKFTATLFYADIEGHPDQKNVQFALQEMGFFSAETRILGVYPASPARAAHQ